MTSHPNPTVSFIVPCYNYAHYLPECMGSLLAQSYRDAGRPAEAMDWYEKAQRLSPPGNDDAILRWNACVRFLERNRDVLPVAEQPGEEAGFSDGAPLR